MFLGFGKVWGWICVDLERFESFYSVDLYSVSEVLEGMWKGFRWFGRIFPEFGRIGIWKDLEFGLVSGYLEEFGKIWKGFLGFGKIPVPLERIGRAFGPRWDG